MLSERPMDWTHRLLPFQSSPYHVKLFFTRRQTWAGSDRAGGKRWERCQLESGANRSRGKGSFIDDAPAQPRGVRRSHPAFVLAFDVLRHCTPPAHLRTCGPGEAMIL